MWSRESVADLEKAANVTPTPKETLNKLSYSASNKAEVGAR